MGSILTIIILYFAFSFVRAVVRPVLSLFISQFGNQGNLGSLVRNLLMHLHKSMTSFQPNDFTKPGNNDYRNQRNSSDRNGKHDTGGSWNNHASGQSNWDSMGKKRMSIQEARDVLGVSETASHNEIMATFKKLMLVNHPDKGGSQYLASKIIEAKETLLH